MYLTLENYDLLDVITFAYEDSTSWGSRADALLVKKVRSKGDADVDIQLSKNESSEKNDDKSSELSDFTLETGSIPETNGKGVEKKQACGMEVGSSLTDHLVSERVVCSIAVFFF